MAINEITWNQIGSTLWVTACALVALILLVCVWDYLDSRWFSSKMDRLKYLKHDSNFENMRLLCARMTHPSRPIGRVIETFAVLLGLLQYFFYLYSTYLMEINASMIVVTSICSSYFLTRIFIRLFLYEPGQRLNVILTYDGLIDISCSFSSVLPFTSFIGSSFTLLFLRPINVYYSYCNVDYLVSKPGTNRFQCSRVQRLLFRISLIIFAFLAMFAGTISTLEHAGNISGWDILVFETFSSFNALYFAITTLATVGFGDVVPITFFGRLFTSLFIIAAIILSATIVNSLLSILTLQGRLVGDGYFLNSSRRPLLIFLGEPSARQVEELLCELFPANTSSRLNFHVVVLLDGNNFHPSMASYLQHHHLFGGRVTYLSGSVGDRLSLERAGAMSKECHAAFILQKRLAINDSVNLLRMLAIRRFCPSLPLFMSLCDSKNKQLCIDSGVKQHNLFLTDTLRHGLLALNAIAPGASTLLINLWSTPVAPIQATHTSPELDCGMTEYLEGMNQQLVEVKVPRWLVGRTIRDSCALIYLAPILRESHQDLEFVSVENLVSSVSSQFHSTAAEGAIVLAIKQRKRDRSSFIHCNVASSQRLRRSDSLFLITKDTSKIGTDVVKLGTNILPITEDVDGEVANDVTETLLTSPIPDDSANDNTLQVTERTTFALPPSTLAGHVIVITHYWLDSLSLFLIPFRLSSLRPVVVLSPCAPPSSDWILKRSREMNVRGVVNLSGLYFVQGDVRNAHEKALCNLDKAHTVVMITTSPPKEKKSQSDSNTGLFHDLFTREEVLKGIEYAEVEVDTDAILATVHLEHNKHELLSIITEVASSKSHLLLGSIAQSSVSSRITRPRSRRRATLSTSDARRLAFRTGRSMRDNNSHHHHHERSSGGGQETIDEEVESSSGSDPDGTVRRRERTPPLPLISVTEAVSPLPLLTPQTTLPLSPDEDETPLDLSPLRLSHRFAAGRLFPSQTLNTLLVQALFNPSLLRLITLFASNQGVRILSIPLSQELLVIPSHIRTFGRIYLHQLLHHNQLTLGLFRGAERRHDANAKSHLPYVFTNPAISTLVDATDLLFVSVPQR